MRAKDSAWVQRPVIQQNLVHADVFTSFAPRSLSLVGLKESEAAAVCRNMAKTGYLDCFMREGEVWYLGRGKTPPPW
jgi:hypothetical protein